MAWYKQQFGEMPREVGKIRAYVDTQTSPEFSSGFKIGQIPNGISLTILRAKKANEGLYFCGLYTWGMLEFSSGTFVAVTGKSPTHSHTQPTFIHNYIGVFTSFIQYKKTNQEKY